MLLKNPLSVIHLIFKKRSCLAAQSTFTNFNLLNIGGGGHGHFILRTMTL